MSKPLALNMSSQTAIAAGLMIASGADGPPKRVQLLPMGIIQMTDGRAPFVLADAAHAAAVIAATQAWAGNRMLPIDYDHQSIVALATGSRAPASGWFDPATLTVEADGIWADIEWTAAAAAALDAKEYRYLSPVFDFAPATRRVLRLTNAALTNNPGFHDMAAVAAADFTQETPMDLSKIAALLGLAATATEDDVLAAISALQPAAACAAEVALAAAKYGAAPTAGVDTIIASALAAALPDPAKFVPMAAFTELQARVTTIDGERAETAVAAAMTAGKITPALKDWATSFAAKDPAAFTAWCSAAPVVIAPGEIIEGGVQLPGEIGVGTDGLDAIERAMCSQMGIAPARYLEVNRKKGA